MHFPAPTIPALRRRGAAAWLAAGLLGAGCATVEPPPSPVLRVVERDLAPPLERVVDRGAPPRATR